MKNVVKTYGKAETVRSRTQSSSESSTKSQPSSVSSRKSTTSNITTTTTSSITRTTAMSPHKFSSMLNKVESLMGRMHHEKLNNFKYLQQEHNQCRKCVDVSQHSTSLDSLANLTDVDSFEGNDTHCTDSDDAEIAHITGTTAVQVHPRRSDLDQLTNGTIREFNGQCFSLGRDSIDMDTEWSAEEDIDNNNIQQQQQQQIHNIFNNNKQNQREENHKNNFEMCNKTIKNTNQDFNDQHKNSYTNKKSKQEKEFNVDSQRSLKINDNENEFVHNMNFNHHKAANISQNIIGIEEIYGCDRKNYAKIQISQNDQQDNKEENMQNNSNSICTGKVRRPSTNSNGSVGRMETILEEPSESKISVREILQRFETMHMSESQSKASTLGSGARAAAQTLNVPLERLESRQSNHRDSSLHSSGNIENHDGKTHHNVNHITETLDHIHDDNHGMEADSLMILNNNGHNERDVQIESNDRHHYMKQQSYVHSTHKPLPQQQQQQQQQQQLQKQYQQQQNEAPRERSDSQQMDGNYLPDEPGAGTPPSVTKFSLLQFAMQHFRNDQVAENRGNARDERRNSSANRTYADMVKWQGTPLRMPLLRLPNDLVPLALECFDCILRYCGDILIDADLSEVKCVYTVLMHCHKYLALRDEVYCQLMKQTTANRSPCPDSSQRAWRLLSILAAYFGCSDALRPYLMEHLTSAASDRRRSCHGTAAVCLTNLRKTARCGGRKNVPSVEEVTAVSAGRSARRQIYRLPGGAERVVNTRCSTVVSDVIAELCALLGIESETEQQEFSLYCIVQGDAFTMPLSADEYILDVTTELLKSGQPFYLVFCRSVWHFPLKRDPVPTPLYIEVLFNQVAPDYLEGLLLEIPGNGVPPPEVVRDMARIAALLHRAADLNHVPAMKEIKFLLPKPALGIREIRPAQWVALVQSAWPQVAGLSPSQVKAQFLNVLSVWPLFGSSFFAVKRIWSEEGPNIDETSPLWRDLILALNRRGVLFLDPNTHETLQHWPYMEVISTRKVRSEDGVLFLDMKVGNLMQQYIVRVRTEQAHEISRLVRQYINMSQLSQRDKREPN